MVSNWTARGVIQICGKRGGGYKIFVIEVEELNLLAAVFPNVLVVVLLGFAAIFHLLNFHLLPLLFSLVLILMF